MESSTSARPPGSKADWAYRTLRAEIRDGRLAGGTAVRASAVASRLGVSVTPVREALRRLETERLITYQTHHGATVVDLGPGAVVEFYGLRAAVEGLGARLAAARISAEEVAALWEVHRRMLERAEAGDGDMLGRLSERLHLRITDIGGPAFLGAQVRAIRSSFPVPAGASLWFDPVLTREHLGAHEQLIDALAGGDADRAERVMSDHVRRSGEHRVARSPSS